VRLDVHFGWPITPAELSGRVVAVIDVLRASSTIAAALYHGARAVVPLESPDEAATRLKAFARADVVLAGERKMLPISGFDVGNSPREMLRETVEGKTVLLTTTNGTMALTGVTGARDVVVASYVNFTAVLTMLRAALRGGTDIAVLCAGRDRQFSLEDAACAGRYVHHVTKRLSNVALNDAATAAMLIDRRYGENLGKLFEASSHGQALKGAGFGEDLVVCSTIDAYGVIPIYQERQITMLGPDRER
jgi:2-phosphosulfolactate phosphatase